MREHNDAVNRLDFISSRDEITTDYAPGETRDVVLHDGGTIRLRKLDDDYDPTDKVGAMAYLEARRARGEVVTGLLYLRSGQRRHARRAATRSTRRSTRSATPSSCPATPRSRRSTRRCADRPVPSPPGEADATL